MKQTIRSIIAGIALVGAIAVAGCSGSVRVGYRAYDPYRADYHVWGADEGVFYNQWAVETHRDPHRDYMRLKSNDRNEYWKWRHDHH
jgi:hypothetical protein